MFMVLLAFIIFVDILDIITIDRFVVGCDGVVFMIGTIPILALSYKLTFCWKQKVVAYLQVWFGKTFTFQICSIFFSKLYDFCSFLFYFFYILKNIVLITCLNCVHARITCKLETLIDSNLKLLPYIVKRHFKTIYTYMFPLINIWTLLLT
jgi:hypothetical protein